MWPLHNMTTINSSGVRLKMGPVQLPHGRLEGGKMDRISNSKKKYTRWEGVSPDVGPSISIFRADFPGFTSKSVEHSRYLLQSCEDANKEE